MKWTQMCRIFSGDGQFLASQRLARNMARQQCSRTRLASWIALFECDGLSELLNAYPAARAVPKLASATSRVSLKFLLSVHTLRYAQLTFKTCRPVSGK